MHARVKCYKIQSTLEFDNQLWNDGILRNFNEIEYWSTFYQDLDKVVLVVYDTLLREVYKRRESASNLTMHSSSDQQKSKKTTYRTQCWCTTKTEEVMELEYTRRCTSFLWRKVCALSSRAFLSYEVCSRYLFTTKANVCSLYVYHSMRATVVCILTVHVRHSDQSSI